MRLRPRGPRSTSARASLSLGQAQLWTTALFGGRGLADTSVLRLAWGAAALAIAFGVRGRRDADVAIAAAGTVMLARLLVEPVLFGYYLVPATVCALIWCARAQYPIVLRALAAAALTAFCMPHTYPQPVFFVMVAFGLAYVCGPMVNSLLPACGQRVGSRQRAPAFDNT